ncbi:pyridoxal phosphate-dependent decarboxylase family protein [Sinomicrobium sp. M5D2P17]
MEDKLADIYNVQKFKEFGIELIDLIADHLKNSYDNKVKVSHWVTPEEQLAYWKNYKLDSNTPQQLFKDIIDRSIHIHNPRYIGHQISPTVPLAALSQLVSAILNNGMAVYEMGAAGTAIEKVVIDKIAEKIGYDSNADGFVTSGGSLANLTALLAAKKVMSTSDVSNDSLAVMVSSEAHYSIEKALKIMGLSNESIINVPVNDAFNMQTDLLEEYYNKAHLEGKKVIAVVGSAPSTSTGMYDNLQELAKFCNAKKIWFHVDAAHGGAAIFSSEYKHLLRGLSNADSVTIDGHKMLMTSSAMSFLIFKEKQNSYAAFMQKAQYLWEKEQEEDWYDLAKRTFECTKSMMCIQFYSILKFYGEDVFGQFVTRLYHLAEIFSEKIKFRNDFELLIQPNSNIVCFRYKLKTLSESKLNRLNGEIRECLLHNGDFYIVQTTLNNSVYLRVTFMNPKTDEKIMDELLSEIQRIAKLFDKK